jgi:outer membrane receptor protein involved in Fe transport
VTTAFDVADWLAGGKGALTYQLGESSLVYALAARGYRAGGVNQHPYLADHSRPFDPEYMLNFEAGYRFTGSKATTALTLFHALRSDQQVDLSSQQDGRDPNSFVFFIANAAEGRNSGIEVEHTYRPTSRIRLFGSLGYLSTHVDAYTFETASGEELTLGDRAAAHAPRYTFRIGGQYRDRTGLFGRLELSAMDEFYFSDSHNQKSDPYQLVNGNIGYGGQSWTVTVWARNLLDERYAVRGFFFGLEPPDYADKLYVTYGDPRQFGLTLTTSFFDRSAGRLY